MNVAPIRADLVCCAHCANYLRPQEAAAHRCPSPQVRRLQAAVTKLLAQLGEEGRMRPELQELREAVRDV